MVYTMLSVFVFALIQASCAQNELLGNPDFEEPLNGRWQCFSCTLTRSTDAYTGQYSAQITNRGANWAGLTQYVTLVGGRSYYFRSMVKFLNELSGYKWHKMDVMLDIDFTDGEKQYQPISISHHSQFAHGWQSHGGDVTLQNKEVRQARVYFQIAESGVNYVVDSTSFTEIIPNPNWLDEANARIEQNRKADITLEVSISEIYDPLNIELDVSLTRHAVPFGSAVNADRIVGTDQVSQRYQDFFYNNFEYSVLENALKWRQMEPNQGDINFDKPNHAINALEARGVPVRGHCVYWEVEKYVPEWLKSMSAEDIRSQIARRADYVVNAFRGRLVHWDVNNEDLHGTFFKDRSGNTSIINYMFTETRWHDPNAKLFLNDYNVVNSNMQTHAYLNQAQRLKKAGIPVYGIGAQSHLAGYLNPDVLKKRLDVLSESGLPIWITELDYPNQDVNARADGYELALRLFYSHPNVDGILLWGFWDGAHWKPEAALVNGDDFNINAAGLRYQQLVKNEWHTSAVLRPTSSSEDLYLRGFQGQYNINIKNQGNTIKTMTFEVPNKVTSYRIQVNVGNRTLNATEGSRGTGRIHTLSLIVFTFSTLCFFVGGASVTWN